MIELYLWLFTMLLASIVTRSWYRHTHTPGIKVVFNIVAFIGVFVHEMAHFILSNMFGVKTGKVSVKYHSRHKISVAPHGSVVLPEFERNSFIQTFVISFAPLFVSTFLFMFCLDIIFRIQTELWIKAVAFVFSISLFIGSEPSGQDVRLVGVTFKRNPNYSLFQIFLVVISGVIVWIFVDLYFISLPFEVLYYIEYFIFVALFYYCLKIIFWVMGKIIKGISTAYGKSIVSSPKFLTRKRRFKEFRKLKEKEAQW
ncbi:MAG: hypothetical protein KGD61_05130 [Candidatus Lokiarchaeota archaeon]|nr:hypothetical protein [Candidatus Lokiarchaeota archaeon]